MAGAGWGCAVTNLGKQVGHENPFKINRVTNLKKGWSRGWSHLSRCSVGEKWACDQPRPKIYVTGADPRAGAREHAGMSHGHVGHNVRLFRWLGVTNLVTNLGSEVGHMVTGIRRARKC